MALTIACLYKIGVIKGGQFLSHFYSDNFVWEIYMKRLLAVIMSLTVAMLAFADVTVKRTADGNAEVTFFYGNPRASEVLLAGNFTNWGDGAEPMEKGEKGFTLTKTFKPTDEVIYKFISDGNWTADLRAPSLIDDGFGGKNSQLIISEVLGGDGNAGGKGKISFQTWTMVGMQSKFSTQSENEPTKKGFDIDSVTFGVKSYNKFVGSFLPQCPVFIELCLSEVDTDEGSITLDPNAKPIYLMQRDKNGNDIVELEDGLKDFVKNITSNLVAYSAQSTGNQNLENPGVGTPAYVGHLKFGFNTPYINFVTGFNYAKPDARQAVLWKTVDASWDAGYQHTGGFNQFSLSDKLAASIEQKTGIMFTAGFAPNKTADRKGTLYGHWGWLGMRMGELVVDVQSNGMYDNGEIFYDSVEQDIIVGAKDSFKLGSGRLSAAAQGLFAFHQKSFSSTELADHKETADFFGYSTDVFLRTGEFEGIKNIAAQVKLGYQQDEFSVDASYRLRGMQASMLYVRENGDDGTFDLSEQLGVLNSQNIDLNANASLLDKALNLSLGVSATLPLEDLSSDTTFSSSNYWAAAGTEAQSWYKSRCASKMEPLMTQTGGAELSFSPSVSYKIPETIYSFTLYGDMNLQAYTYGKDVFGQDIDADEANKYSASDSAFRFKKAGLTFALSDIGFNLRNITFSYGFDNSNAVRLFNTLVARTELPGTLYIDAGVGVKTVKNTEAAEKYDEDLNNPFAFMIGVSKKLKGLKEPVVYAQFVYNMDGFKRFGEGQDNLALDRANIQSRWDKGSTGAGTVDAVDYYDGKAAVRCGIRWEI